MRFRNELARFMCGWRTNRAAAITHPHPSLHISLIIIDDAYNGITFIDGQPTRAEAGLRNVLRIRINMYTNSLPPRVSWSRFHWRRPMA